jgi:hypothetical protein
MTDEQIHNIYLHQGGVAEGLLRTGADADFPVMFARALIEFYEGEKQLTVEDLQNGNYRLS